MGHYGLKCKHSTELIRPIVFISETKPEIEQHIPALPYVAFLLLTLSLS